MNFWNNYQYLCTKNGLSPYAVAKKCGIKSSATVSYWRQGSVPKPDILNNISQLFSVPAIDLLEANLSGLDALSAAPSSTSEDPLYAAIMKLTPQKRSLAMAFIAGLNAE